MRQKLAGVAFGTASLIFGSAIYAQTAPPPMPAAALPPTSQPSGPPILAEEANRVHLRSLSVVEDARQSQTNWHTAAKHAEDQLTNPDLRQKLEDRLNLMSTKVADALIKQPGETAVVTIAVYSDPSSDNQQSVAVAYEGTGEALNPSFFPRLLADMPFPDEQQKEQNRGLVLDTQGSSYMLYHLDAGDLKAANISQGKMKESFGIALTKARQPVVAGAGGLPPIAPPPVQVAQAQPQAQAAPDQSPAQNPPVNAYAQNNTGAWGWGTNPLWQPYWVVVNANAPEQLHGGDHHERPVGTVGNAPANATGAPANTAAAPAQAQRAPAAVPAAPPAAPAAAPAAGAGQAPAAGGGHR